MKVLMLGWEYPPHISGGLGTACEGLTKALSRQNVDITFIVPHLYGGEDASHMMLVDSTSETVQVDERSTVQKHVSSVGGQGSITTKLIPAFLQPYWTDSVYQEELQRRGRELADGSFEETLSASGRTIRRKTTQTSGPHYGGSIFKEVERFTQNAVRVALQDPSFDVIHGHDWMTYPAAIAIKEATGKPLILHVHSLEFDRSGQHVNPMIDQIERLGTSRADIVAAVSHYTASVIAREHGVQREKIAVVHNGIYTKETIAENKKLDNFGENIVLFLGRVTFQKGPDYFVEAAAKALPHVPDAVFVLAGTGDMLPHIQAKAEELGIADHFRFPGFVRGEELERLLSVASVYVMPSVSEPFGLSALEAISFDTPAIISYQSGVSEVVGHALKFDFWDVEKLADLIVSALRYKELRSDMVLMAKEELKRLKWDAAAKKTAEIYSRLV